MAAEPAAPPASRPVGELSERELLEEIADRLRTLDRFYAAWATSGLSGLRAAAKSWRPR